MRIVEKGEKKATVKVNLPLALVHAFGDDVPIPGCGEKSGRHLTVGEVLRALDTGESLVEIEDDDADRPGLGRVAAARSAEAEPLPAPGDTLMCAGGDGAPGARP